tara:strand:- start:1362 stop:2051 length:690 start_codon:yes stop_codon:yes gene_type:complete
MHQSIDKKRKYIFLIIIFFFLSTINNINFVNNSSSSIVIENIEVKGLSKELNFKIKEKLKYLKNSNIFQVNKSKVENEIKKLNFIENFSVKKLYPKNIILNLNQTEFLAITIKENKKYIIGSNGKLISHELFSNYKNLPMIFGDFEINDFLDFKNKIDKSRFKFNEIENFFFFPSKRWDIQTRNNTIIRLPNNNIELALKRAKKIIESNKFNNKTIDLRVTKQIIFSNE